MTQLSRSGCAKQLVSLGLQTVYRPLLQSGRVMVRDDLFIRDPVPSDPLYGWTAFLKRHYTQGKSRDQVTSTDLCRTRAIR